MKKRKNNIRVGISVGDTNGIGPEIILKTLQKKELLSFFTPVVFGSTKLFSYYKNALDITANINGVRHPENAVDNKINVVNIWQNSLDISIGIPTDASGRYAFDSLQHATRALKTGLVDILVTAPINKANIQSEAFSFSGHTEYLESELEGEALMFMVHDDIKVGLVTNHLPISKVSKEITEKKIRRKARLIHQSLVQEFQIQKPKIAILSLNPHSGDHGLMGDEEANKIIPAIDRLKEEGILAFGPFAADSFFGAGEYVNFDAVLAMYHDQGLIPFKQITFGKGVNFTAGLNRIRTSPDHGTAYDISGKNIARGQSFEEAVFKGIQLFKTRNEFLELRREVLKKQDELPQKNNGYYSKEKKFSN